MSEKKNGEKNEQKRLELVLNLPHFLVFNDNDFPFGSGLMMMRGRLGGEVP